mgnify:CR=1 FL=1
MNGEGEKDGRGEKRGGLASEELNWPDCLPPSTT